MIVTFRKTSCKKNGIICGLKVWLIAGREVQIKEPGDYIVHDLITESVIIVRQDDGSIKGFYNSCAHRGQRLVNFDSSQDSFRCPYHDWQFGLNGDVIGCPDPDDFPEGSPIGKRKLVEVRVDTWDGFIFYTMNDEGARIIGISRPSYRKYIKTITLKTR